jgi:hypothetical protein
MSGVPLGRALACAAGIFALSSAGQALAAPLSLEVRDLNGRALTVPGGLPAQRTLLLVGFRHADHAALDGWRQGLRLSPTDAAWLETPVIRVRSGLIRRMILDGMRSGASTPEARAHLAPAFADPGTVAAELGVDPGRAAVVVVDRSGRVLARASGAYDPAQARALAAAMR